MRDSNIEVKDLYDNDKYNNITIIAIIIRNMNSAGSPRM